MKKISVGAFFIGVLIKNCSTINIVCVLGVLFSDLESMHTLS